MSAFWTEMQTLFRNTGNGQSVCMVCPHHCLLSAGQIGRCGVRQGTGSSVQPVSAQCFAATGIGPIEEYSLFHFFPRMRVLAVGCMGCNATCCYCQNWELAQVPHVLPEWNMPAVFPTADAIIAQAHAKTCAALVLTCNEPTVWIEAMIAVAQQAQDVGLKVVLVTNGFMTEQSRSFLLPHVDAVRLDLKGWDTPSYQSLAGLSLDPVIATLDYLRDAHIWYEISTVILPGVHDTPSVVSRIIALIQQVAGQETPWHLMRVFPAYQMLHIAPTELITLRHIQQQAKAAGQQYVYISNIPGIAERRSFCPHCQTLLASRSVGSSNEQTGTCPACGFVIAGRFADV